MWRASCTAISVLFLTWPWAPVRALQTVHFHAECLETAMCRTSCHRAPLESYHLVFQKLFLIMYSTGIRCIRSRWEIRLPRPKVEPAALQISQKDGNIHNFSSKENSNNSYTLQSTHTPTHTKIYVHLHKQTADSILGNSTCNLRIHRKTERTDGART